MNNCPHGRGRSPRPPWPRRARVAAVSTVMAAALLAAACGGSPSSIGSGGSPTAGGSANPSWVAYSRCVRAQGVPDFPDPDSNGQIPKEAAVRALRGVGDSRAKAATYACRDLNPNRQGSPTITAQEQQYYLRAAACMRSHGITNFPDPTFPGGRVEGSIPTSIDTKSRQFIQAAQTCTQLLPVGLPYSRPGG
jgi:hypothetical protein